MKRFASLLMALLAVSLMAADKGRLEVDRASAELAASLVLNKLAGEILDKPAVGNKIYAAMTADSGAYADPDVAETNLVASYAAEIAGNYAEEALKVLDRLAGERSRSDVFGVKFLGNAVTLPTNILVSAVKKDYKKVFRTVRERVCREQAETLKSGICPTEIEIETLSREELSALMTKRIADRQDVHVFKENLQFISESFVKPMLDDAYAQRDGQITLVKTSSVSGVAPSVIASNLIDRLTGDISSRKKTASNGVNVYGVFPSVTNDVLAKSVSKRMLDGFSGAVASTQVLIDCKAIEAAISADPAKHHSVKDSVSVFTPDISARLREDSLLKLIESASVAEHGELREYMWNNKDDPSFAKPVKNKVGQSLSEVLKTIRSDVAEKQLVKLFGEKLASGRWYPESQLVDIVCDKTDFRKALDSWRNFDDLGQLVKAEKDGWALEETSALLNDAVTKAFDLGAAARKTQHKITAGYFQSVKDAVKAMEKKPELPIIVRMYTEKVKDGWSKGRQEVLHYGESREDDGAYTELFKSTVEQIETLSKTIFDAIEAEKEVKPVEEPPPENDPPPPEELEIVEMHCDFVFDRSGDELVAAVVVDGKKTGEYKCPYSQKSYKKEMDGFVSSVSKSLLNRVREATAKNRISLFVTICVKDPFVYYSTVSGVTKKVETGVSEFGEYVTGCEVSGK